MSQKHSQIRLTLTILAIISIVAFLSFYKLHAFTVYQTSYWIWAGITTKDAPENSELYIYQGLILTRNGNTTYERIGLYPHPVKAKKTFLSYRLEGDLPEGHFVVDVFNQNLKGWKRHGIEMAGLQIDFDSATSKLLIYNNFLKELRKQLPKQYALSITGLSDWAVNGNQEVIGDIVTVTDEIIFQLYQDRNPLENIDFYIRSLSKYPYPFRVGLLASRDNTTYINGLRRSKNFRGVVYFLQK